MARCPTPTIPHTAHELGGCSTAEQRRHTCAGTHPPSRPRRRPAGLPCQGWAAEAAQLLEEVRLTEAAGVRAGAYSGGMKRRLSVAIALLGDPKVSETGLPPAVHTGGGCCGCRLALLAAGLLRRPAFPLSMTVLGLGVI